MQLHRYAWANIAVDANDQLRQRMAWALIQTLVINDSEDGSGITASRGYYNFMIDRAFGNYRDLLADVTFSHPMGKYLTYIDNRKADEVAGTSPDENYAREIMQLFSIGLFELNMDGTQKLDSNGDPIPTYTNDEIQQFARVFTGLRRSSIGETNLIRESNPMRMDVGRHEFGSKQLLDYPGAANNGFIPARPVEEETEANGLADVNFAIDNVFNHPNVPPFISRQLIQRMVTSNPTPAYVERVSNVFADNGSGVRGDLGAVVKAILLDPEARDRTYSSNPYFGKIVEPYLVKWALYRVLDRRDKPSEQIGLRVDQNQNSVFNDYKQSYLTSPTVFNFYLPDFTVVNSGLDKRGLDIPEAQIIEDISIFSVINNLLSSHIDETGDKEASVYAPLQAVADDPSALVDEVSDLLMYGTLSPEAKAIIVNTISTESNNLNRVRTAIWLTITTPEFQVIN
ncbi:uncharacterized protein (DUF1800 family) [Algisphaera agarilytica]|uniref:Uncharacterized protein (DUF1800 family) n=1 Tax=Algisphaera agarilytica TaxID=1385975 RepID=A0A7X0H7G1_9BACT|nr:uncharacterized protein (DUF1800 family) [Algisphaera agarilytica]